MASAPITGCVRTFILYMLFGDTVAMHSPGLKLDFVIWSVSGLIGMFVVAFVRYYAWRIQTGISGSENHDMISQSF